MEAVELHENSLQITFSFKLDKWANLLRYCMVKIVDFYSKTWNGESLSIKCPKVKKWNYMGYSDSSRNSDMVGI